MWHSQKIHYRWINHSILKTCTPGRLACNQCWGRVVQHPGRCYWTRWAYHPVIFGAPIVHPPVPRLPLVGIEVVLHKYGHLFGLQQLGVGGYTHDVFFFFYVGCWGECGSSGLTAVVVGEDRKPQPSGSEAEVHLLPTTDREHAFTLVPVTQRNSVWCLKSIHTLRAGNLSSFLYYLLGYKPTRI